MRSDEFLRDGLLPPVFVAVLAAAPGSGVHDLATAAGYLRAERDLTLRLLAGWDVHVLPAAAPDDLLQDALAVLTS